MSQQNVYDDYSTSFPLLGKSRKEMRDTLVTKFLDEPPGYWRDGVKHIIRYKYFVETLKDGRRVYLKRPARLNKGVDFEVWVEKIDGVKDKRPSHKNIFDDLKLKKKEDPTSCMLLQQAISEICECKEPDEVLKRTPLDYCEGLLPELLLKILKWLFIEQDITYWNYEGRSMLKRGIDEELNS